MKTKKQAKTDSLSSFHYNPVIHTKKDVTRIANQIFLEVGFDLGTEDSQSDEAQDTISNRLSDFGVPDNIIVDVLKQI
jgi:hypothetical protein